MMRITSQKMDPVTLQKRVRKSLGKPAESTVERCGGYLNQAALAHPLRQLFRILLKDRVALWMRDD